MHHDTPLLATIVAGLVLAFIMGSLAHRLKLSPLIGYLAAGVLVGPFTPGFVADGELATELAEIGVILLMFGVGLHFSLRDLMAVRRIAVPGAIVQIAAATAMGVVLAMVLGWGWVAGIIFGLALSVASTVVLLRALQDEGIIETERGRIAVGWLIVEDLVMVLALVLIPAVAAAMADGGTGGIGALGLALGTTALKVIGFVAVMLIVGRRAIPAMLHWVVRSGSRELFRLAVLAVALGVAFGAAYLFSVSFALGAFFAGMILGETQLSRRATEETLPLRDAFAVLFFVSVGMLFNPAVMVEQPLALLATLAIIVFGKSLAAYAIMRTAGRTKQGALTVSASLAQIGEFSFILAGLGVGTNLMPAAAQDLILAGAMGSIVVNPFLFRFLRRRGTDDAVEPVPVETAVATGGRSLIVIGFGRVGGILAGHLHAAGRSFRIVEEQPDRCDDAKERGFDIVQGDAGTDAALAKGGIKDASTMFVAIPEGYEAGAVVERAKRLHPGLTVVARAHSDEEAAYLAKSGADHVVIGERELAAKMLAICDETSYAPNPSPRP